MKTLGLLALGLVFTALALAVPAVVTTPPPPATRRRRVSGQEWTAGVHPRLLALLEAWDENGTHDVVVPGPELLAAIRGPPAGVRRDPAAQAAAYEAGLTEARALTDTAHGVGAALDVWPVGFNPRVPWEQQPAHIREQFLAFGRFAEARGLVWGGRWRSAKLPHGDQPHVQLPDWRSIA